MQNLLKYRVTKLYNKLEHFWCLLFSDYSFCVLYSLEFYKNINLLVFLSVSKLSDILNLLVFFFLEVWKQFRTSIFLCKDWNAFLFMVNCKEVSVFYLCLTIWNLEKKTLKEIWWLKCHSCNMYTLIQWKICPNNDAFLVNAPMI
jgi:hypothetical protein